jgi:two-component system CheB/CheR fusion protein
VSEDICGPRSATIKNLLTVVQSIAHQTLGGEASRDFERFDGCLTALATVHNRLLDSDWKGADLATLVRSQLEPHVSNDSQSLRIEGEPILLPPEIATPLGLIVHELATNADKYGALSPSGGKIDLSWTLDRGHNPTPSSLKKCRVFYEIILRRKRCSPINANASRSPVTHRTITQRI